MSRFNEYLEAVKAMTPYTKSLMKDIKKILKAEGITAKVSAKKSGVGFEIRIDGKYVHHSETPIKFDDLKKKVLNKVKNGK